MKKNVEVGMPTLIELPDLYANVKLAKDLELDFVEINMNMPDFQAQNIDVSNALKLMDEGIYFTFHLDENFNAFDFNAKVREAYLDTLIETINLAKSINSPVINLHMPEGVHFKLPGEKIYLFEKFNSHFIRAVAEMRNACEKAIDGSEVSICIENTGGFMEYMQEGIESLLKSQCFNLTFDIGHNHCANHADDLFYEKHAKRIRHMHIHDANPQTCHLIFGEGELDIHKYFSFASDNDCRVVIETKSIAGLKKSIEFLNGL